MTQSRSDHRGNHHGRQKGVQNAEVNALVFEYFFHPAESQEKSEKKEKLVVADEERTEFNAAVGDPSDGGKHGLKLGFLAQPWPEDSDFLGTGSNPEVPQGWQRPNLLIVSHDPEKGPHSLMASPA
jgi:hypothetical protein